MAPLPQTTPKPLSKGAQQRTEEADPNEKRCLIENTDWAGTTELACVWNREDSGDRDLMKNVECAWGMIEGTLNLDTRKNLFFLGASMHVLYKRGWWALLPEESVIDMYFAEPDAHGGNTVLPPERLPTFKGELFKYTFVALNHMRFAITRHDSGNFQVHTHPFNAFPTMTSHIHPRFVIASLARKVSSGIEQGDQFIEDLVERNSIVKKALVLGKGWFGDEDKGDGKITGGKDAGRKGKGVLKEAVEGDGEEEEEQEDMWDYEESDGDSVCTVPRRVWYPRKSKTYEE